MWINEKIKECSENKENIILMDVSFEVGSESEENNEIVSANLSFMPLESQDPD